MNVLSSKEKFEDTKVVIISRKLKEGRQWLKAKGQKDNDLPKTKDRATRIPQKRGWGIWGMSHLFQNGDKFLLH